MTFQICDDWPDEAFPALFGLSHEPLVSLPERGNGVVQECKACGRRVMFTGRDLCRLFPAWLTRDVWAWAAAMKCDECPSPRQAFSCIRDHAADGFSRGHADPMEAQRIRRLMEWLPLGGLRIDDVAYLIQDVDATKLRRAGFEDETVKLFTSPYDSGHYRPTTVARLTAPAMPVSR